MRNRQSEVLALKRLSSAIKKRCCPLLDLPAPTKGADKTASQAYTLRNVERSARALPGFDRVLLDSSELDPSLRISGEHPLVVSAKAAAKAAALPIPVTGLHRDASHNAAVLKIRDQMSSPAICFRFDSTDIGTASLSFKQVVAWAASNGVATTDIILLLDQQSLYGADVVAAASAVSNFLAQVSKAEWAAVIVAGYGIPDQLSDAVPVRAQGYIPRIEQAVFQRVMKGVMSGNIWFGDYTTLPPTQVELDWRIISRVMSPKAAYALDDVWFVVRGGPFSSHRDGYQQYYDVAAEIVALTEYSGEHYSAGDQYIFQSAQRALTGNPASWITACVNHHITLTANQHHS